LPQWVCICGSSKPAFIEAPAQYVKQGKPDGCKQWCGVNQGSIGVGFKVVHIPAILLSNLAISVVRVLKTALLQLS
jgi:hypothetical protein